MQAGDADRQALGVGMYVQRDVGDVGMMCIKPKAALAMRMRL